MKVNSSNISDLAYNPATKVLTVTFKSGGTYSYENVDPEKYQALMSAESIGKHLHQHIKPFHTTRKHSF